MQETTVALGIPEPGLQEEVLHFLERMPGVSVVGAAEDKGSLRSLVRHRHPDVVIGAPEQLAGLDSAQLVAVASSETTAGLRTAIRVGARGFYVWPGERDALGHGIKEMGSPVTRESLVEGRVISVIGARGGAGVTFLSTNLAAAVAKTGASVVLADLDPLYGDVATALGISPETSSPSVVELAAISRELTDEHLEGALHAHPSGLQAILAPTRPGTASRLDPENIPGLVFALRSRFAAVVLHLPRIGDESIRAAVQESNETLVVVTLDVLGIRAAKRLIDHLRSHGLGESLRLVVNKAGRGEIVPEDAELVLETPLACVIGADRAVPRAQNRAELVIGKKGGLTRRLGRLAGSLLDRRAA
jgi:Flp pilus assembly CpaE family ATPase